MSNDVDIMRLDIDVTAIDEEEIRSKIGVVSPKIKWLADIFKSDVFDSIVAAYDNDAFEMLPIQLVRNEETTKRLLNYIHYHMINQGVYIL